METQVHTSVHSAHRHPSRNTQKQHPDTRISNGLANQSCCEASEVSLIQSGTSSTEERQLKRQLQKNENLRNEKNEDAAGNGKE